MVLAILPEDMAGRWLNGVFDTAAVTPLEDPEGLLKGVVDTLPAKPLKDQVGGLSKDQVESNDEEPG